MPIDVNSYNAQFSQFVKLAERQMQAGKAKAFASLGAEGATGLAARDIKPGSGDSVHAWIRYKDSKIANDAVRELFRQSVAAMFGGNDRIPEDVQKAMLLKDYGKMLALYSSIANGDYNEGLDREAAIRLEDRAGSHMTHIAVFKESIDRALGAPLGTGLVPFAGAFNADAISGPDILDDLMR